MVIRRRCIWIQGGRRRRRHRVGGSRVAMGGRRRCGIMLMVMVMGVGEGEKARLMLTMVLWVIMVGWRWRVCVLLVLVLMLILMMLLMMRVGVGLISSSSSGGCAGILSFCLLLRCLRPLDLKWSASPGKVWEWSRIGEGGQCCKSRRLVRKLNEPCPFAPVGIVVAKNHGLQYLAIFPEKSS
jgi:hypothetical protein